MYYPGIQNQCTPDGQPQALNAPPMTNVRIDASADWWKNNPAQDAMDAANNIIASHYGDLAQFVYGSRQMRGNSQYQRVARDWGNMRVEFSYYSSLEKLLITLLPENVPTTSGSSIDVGGQAKITWDFIAFPEPGMTQTGGSTVPSAMKTYGVTYWYDPCFLPSGPGPSSTMGSDKFLTSTNPDMTVDPWCQSPGVFDPTLQVINLGASAVMTTPLSGKQYWEVEIVRLPRGASPDDFFTPLAPITVTGADGTVVSGVAWDGSGLTSSIENVGPTGTQYTWDPTVDAFLTPCIGICPGYFMPDDLLPGSPTATPRVFKDFGRTLGMDQYMDNTSNIYDQARSIYLMAGCLDVITSTASTYTPGTWVAKFQSPAGGFPTPPGVNVGDIVFSVQTNNITSPPPGGTAFPDYKSDLTGGNTSGPGSHFAVSNTDGVWYCRYTLWSENFELNDMTPPQIGVPPLTGLPSVTNVGITQATKYSSTGGPPSGSKSVTQYTTQPPPNGDGTGWMQYEGVWWALVGVAGPTITATFNLYEMNVIYSFTPGFTTSGLSGDTLIGELRGGSNDSSAQPSTDAWKKFMTAGYHTPVFIGRADTASIGSSDTSDGTDSWNLTPQTEGTGVQSSYTGIDFGQLNNGDIIMIATDADTGYVWFGKNGSWWLSDGSQVSASAKGGPAAGTGWAAIMDGAKKSARPITTPSGTWDRSTAQPQYFPCVSWRYGPGAVNINYSQSKLKYSPPAGFTVYAQSTIALP